MNEELPRENSRIAIGISISETDDDKMQKNGFTKMHLTDFFVEFCRYLIASGYNIVYGGDLRKSGYTDILIELFRQYHYEVSEKHPVSNKIINYLAWPFYHQLSGITEKNLRDIIVFVKIDPPKNQKIDLKKEVNFSKIKPDEEKALKASLTYMRCVMIEACDFRIQMGGKIDSYLGIAPGIIEETYTAIQKDVPVFLVGMFGGATGIIIDHLCKTPCEGESPKDKEACSISKPKQNLNEITKSMLSYLSEVISTPCKLNNGLNCVENKMLFVSDDFDLVLALILKGIRSKGKVPKCNKTNKGDLCQ